MPNSSGSGPGSADYDRFDQLAEEFAERHRRGERPSLQEYIDQHPELAEEIRDLFPALIEVERADGEHRQAAQAAPTPPPMGLVGDYRILREIGRGGMGVVYEAEQVSLGRRVALKLLPAQVARDRKTLARFRREARSAAGLHHTNIVPVYEVGKDGDVSFYAMQFIQGQAIDSVIHELRRIKDHARPINAGSTKPSAGSGPDRGLNRMACSLLTGQFAAEGAATETHTGLQTGALDGSTQEAPRIPDVRPEATAGSSSAVLPGGSQISTIDSGRRPFFRSVAQIGRQVAAGLAYAHARGIVHRDVKPSNLMLDTEGVVWITDFGLAKAADDGLTQTGDILGTLRYMAPERFRGEGDGRADLYALGLTLYEVLVLRAAFDSPDRLKLIEQIKDSEPPRPRSLDPRIPRDLETIILKAIDKEPRARYATADAMAEDLRRFIDDEPILARRDSLAEKVTRMARRNPAIASLAAVLFGTLLIVTIGSLMAANRMRKLVINEKAATRTAQAERLAADTSRKNEATERARAEKGLSLAEANFEKARAAVDDYLTKVTDSQLLTAPGMQSLRRNLLRSALKFYDEFLKERRDDPKLRAALAAVHLRVAQIHKEAGDLKAMADEANEAVRLYEALAKESPGSAEFRQGLLESLYRAGSFSRGIEVGEALLRDHPGRLGGRSALSDCYNGRNIELSSESDIGGALRAMERCLDLCQGLVKDDPANARYQAGLGIALTNIASLATRVGMEFDGLGLHRRGAARYRTALDLRPNDDTYARLYTNSIRQMLKSERDNGLAGPAMETNREGMELSRKLAIANPEISSFAISRVEFAYDLGDGLATAGRTREAIAAYREAIEAAGTPLVQDNPAMRAWAAAAAAQSAELLGGEGAIDAVDSKAERDRLIAFAMREMTRAVDAGAVGNVDYLPKNRNLKILRDREDFRALQKKVEAAEKANRTAGVDRRRDGSDAAPSRAIPPVAAGSPDRDPMLRGDLASADFVIGVVRLRIGDLDGARESLDRARVVREALVRAEPGNARYRCDLGMLHFILGDLAATERRDLDRSREWLAARDILLPLVNEPGVQPAVVGEALAKLYWLANWADMRGLGGLATEILKPTIESKSKFESGLLLAYGRTCVLRGDLAEYRRASGILSRIFLNEEERGVYDADTAMIYAIAPDSGIAPEVALRAGKAGLRQNSSHDVGTDWSRAYLAMAHYRAGHPEEALPLVDEVLAKAVKSHALPPFTTYCRLIRALVLHKLGRVEEARRILAEARAERDRVALEVMGQPLRDAATDPWGWGFTRIFLREAATLLDADPGRDEPWNELYEAWAEAGFGRGDHARSALARMPAIPEGSAALHAARGHVWGLLGEADKAKADQEIAFRLDPENSLVHRDRGLAALKEGRPEDAASELVVALASLAENRDLGAPRNQIDGPLAATDAAFRRAVALRPDDPQLWVARGRYLAWRGRWKEAADAYAAGVEKRPIHVDWIEYADVLVLAGDLDGYRAFCRRIADRVAAPGGLKGGVWDEVDVRALAARAVSAHPDSGLGPKIIVGWAEKSNATREGGQRKLALGLALHRAGDANKAGGTLLNLFSDSPTWYGNLQGYYVLAMSYHRLGQVENARRTFDMAEAILARREREAAKTDYLPIAYYVDELLAAKVFQREAKAVLATKPGDLKPATRPASEK